MKLDIVIKLLTPIMLLILIIVSIATSINDNKDESNLYLIDTVIILEYGDNIVLEKGDKYKLLISGMNNDNETFEVKWVTLEVKWLQKHDPRSPGYSYAVIKMKESQFEIFKSPHLIIFEVKEMK